MPVFATLLPVLINLALGALIPILGYTWPKVVEAIQTKTHSQKLALIAQLSGAVAYKSMVAAQQKGLDYHAAETAAIQAGVQAIQNMAIPALATLAAPTIQAAVESGLGAALAADPSVTVVKPVSAPAPAQGANTLTSLMGIAKTLSASQAAPQSAPVAQALPVVTQQPAVLPAPVATVVALAAPESAPAPAAAEMSPEAIEKPAVLDAVPAS